MENIENKEIKTVPSFSKYKDMTPYQYSILATLSGRDRTRFIARSRDKWTCQDCGDIRTPEYANEHGKRMFDIHHIHGLCGKRSKKYDRISHLHHLVTLCHKCHFNRPEHRTKKNSADRMLKRMLKRALLDNAE